MTDMMQAPESEAKVSLCEDIPSPTQESPVLPEPTEQPAEDEQAETIDYERLASEDLAEIKRLDPVYAPAAHLSELPFARRFAQLRDLGLSVKEALAAASPRFERNDSRAHLRAVAPHGGKAAPEGLDRSQMKDARMLFGNLSDAEINALYRRVTHKNND